MLDQVVPMIMFLSFFRMDALLYKFIGVPFRTGSQTVLVAFRDCVEFSRLCCQVIVTSVSWLYQPYHYDLKVYFCDSYVSRSLGKMSSKASTPQDTQSRPVPAPRVSKRPITWLGQQEKILFERDSSVPQSGSRDKFVMSDKNSAEGDLEKEEKQRLELETMRHRIDELLAAIRDDAAELVQVSDIRLSQVYSLMDCNYTF